MNYRWDRPGTIHYMLRTKYGNMNIDVHAIDGDKHWDVRWHIDEDKSTNLHFALIPITEFTSKEAVLVSEMCEHYSEKNRWQYYEYYGPDLSPIPSFVCSKCQTYLNEDPDPTVSIKHYICTACLSMKKPVFVPKNNGWPLEKIILHQDLLTKISSLEYAISCMHREYNNVAKDMHENVQLLNKQALMIVNQQLIEGAEEFLKAQRILSVQQKYAKNLSDDIQKTEGKLIRRKKELQTFEKLAKEQFYETT